MHHFFAGSASKEEEGESPKKRETSPPHPSYLHFNFFIRRALPRRIMNRFMIIRYFSLTVDMSPVKTQPVSREQQRQVETWSAIFDYSNHRFPTEQTMTIGKLHRCLPPPPPPLPTPASGSHSDALQSIEPLFYSPLPTVQFSISSSSSCLECGCQDHLAPPSDQSLAGVDSREVRWPGNKNKFRSWLWVTVGWRRGYCYYSRMYIFFCLA